MTFEGRQLLYRVGIYCSREWGDALARQMEQSADRGARVYVDRGGATIVFVHPDAPFEINVWHDALEIVDDLRNGRPVREKYRCG